MTKLLARTLSFTFAPALIALVGISSSTLGAIEPQNIPAKPALVQGSVDSSADSSAAANDTKKSTAKKHKKHHHHKGQAGRR